MPLSHYQFHITAHTQTKQQQNLYRTVMALKSKPFVTKIPL